MSVLIYAGRRNLIVLFAGWTIDSKMFGAIGIGLVLLGVSQLSRPREERVKLDWPPRRGCGRGCSACSS